MIIPKLCKRGAGPLNHLGALEFAPGVSIECWGNETEYCSVDGIHPVYTITIKDKTKLYDSSADCVLGVLSEDGITHRFYWVDKEGGVLSYMGFEFRVWQQSVENMETVGVFSTAYNGWTLPKHATMFTMEVEVVK